MNHMLAAASPIMALLCTACGVYAGSLPLDKITLPPGFSITVYADNVPNARGMALGQNGTLFVGSRSKGEVYAVVDKDGDHRADEVMTIARGLQMPVL